MSSNRIAPERIDLASADDPRDAAHRAVACLAQGGVVALPTETGLALVASALNLGALERLQRIKGGPTPRPFSLAARTAEELDDWVPDVSDVGRKLSRRAWPGPLTLIVRGDLSRGLVSRLGPEIRAIVAPEETIALRIPGHDLTREIFDLVPGPLVVTDGSPAALEAGDLEMILDAGPSRYAGRNTVVLVEGDRWSIAREGVIGPAAVKRMVGTVILFVCTGNTCRSPMAEALCRLLIAERLGCRPEEVADRGYVVASAGLAASRGARAAADAMDVVAARGGSLRGHAGRQVGPAMIAGADRILAMTRDHRDALLEEFPEAEGKIALLHPDGGDIADPIGCDRETYRRTARAIEAHLARLLNELGLA